MPKQTNTIHPKALKVARKRRNPRKNLLKPEVQQGYRQPLGAWFYQASTIALRCIMRRIRVEWVKQPPDEETRDPWTRKKQISVDMDLRNSLQLVYGVRLQAVLELAFAERSLMWRQKKLKEIADVWNEAEETFKCGHLGGIIAARSVSGQTGFSESCLDAPSIISEGSEGPFLHFVRKFMEGLPEGAVSDIESINGDTIFGYTVASDTLEKCTGLSRNNEMDTPHRSYPLRIH